MPTPEIDSMIVAFSCGKDSLVALDICSKRFKKIAAYFMWYVEGLSFDNAVLRWAEQRYGITIKRIPHWELASLLKHGAFTHATRNVKNQKPKDVEDLMRAEFGIDWIASGESKYESIERRAMLGALGTDLRCGVFDEKRKRYFPLADMPQSAVLNYMKRNGIPAPPIYKHLNRSFNLRGADASVLKTHYPDDYERVIAVFPLLEAMRIRHEQSTRIQNRSTDHEEVSNL
jgi:phosphoadenosine phosphosulfate reductase